MTGWIEEISRLLCGGTSQSSKFGTGPPTYVEIDGDWCRRHPGTLEQVTMQLFPVKTQSGGTAELTDLCEHLVNQRNSPIRALPYLPGVLVAIVDNKWAYSDDDGDGSRGHLSYREAGIFVPVELWDAEKRFGVTALVPYLFADQFSAIVMGRESYGFPKQLAEFHFNEPNRHCWVRADVFPEFKRVQPVQRATVLDIKPKGEIQEEPILIEAVDEAMATIARKFATALGGDEKAEAIEGFKAVSLVLLKQFRDAKDAALACYQSLVRADCEISRLRDVPYWLSGAFSVTMRDYESLHMAKTLGLAETSEAPFGIRLDLDFTLHPGKTLWAAP